MIVKSSPSNDRKRTLSRNSCLIPVNCNFKDRTYDGLILDINSYGTYVDTNEPFLIGQERYLSLTPFPINIWTRVEKLSGALQMESV